MNASFLRPGDIIRIEKLAPNGQPVISYDGWLVHDGDPILLLAVWQNADLAKPYTIFARGDLLLEAYYRQRPYNIFALFDGVQAPPDADWGKILADSSDSRPDSASLQPLCQAVAAQCPLKGYYINFTRPVRYEPASRRLVWRDMALDIWVPADGPPLALDEDEYRALNLRQTEPELDRRIQQARRNLLHQAKAHTGIFVAQSK